MPERHRVAVSAHRGGAERAPAQTLAAYADALDAGADYVEFDGRRTRDGQLIVFHDAWAAQSGARPEALSRSELDAAIGREVLGVTELLTAIKGRTKAHVDVKQPGYEADIVTAALDVLAPGDIVLTGEDGVVTAVKRDFPDVRAALTVGRGWREIPWSSVISQRWNEVHPLRRVEACGADAVAVHYRLARLGALADCARHGIGTMVWTVNDSAMIHRYLADRRVDVLITDRPRYALGERDRTAGS